MGWVRGRRKPDHHPGFTLPIDISPRAPAYLLPRSLSLFITDHESLFFTDKNQWHIFAWLVRGTRRHKRHRCLGSHKTLNLLTFIRVLCLLPSSLLPPFVSLSSFSERLSSPFHRDVVASDQTILGSRSHVISVPGSKGTPAKMILHPFVRLKRSVTDL